MTSPVLERVLEEAHRLRLSQMVSIAAFGVMTALGFAQFWKDGSFWIDEASVALSLLELDPLELFGRLVGAQSFPRVYLFAIRGLVGLFGYDTMVARALPQLFFWAATLVWVRILYLRFRHEPLLIVLGTLLLLIPAPWFLFAAMLKPYTLDVLLATVPFLLRDEFYDSVLERGRSPGRLLALTALGGLSYPFAMSLLARCGGWWLVRASTRRFRVSLRGALIGLGGIALFSAAVWITDLRHTTAIGDALADYWSSCLIGAEGTRTLTLLDRFAFGWFDGRADFSRGAVLDTASLIAVKLGFGLGLARLAIGLFVNVDARALHGWGSRSVGCALLLGGLPFASWWIGYPICAGRLTLFALLPMMLVTLEGFSLVGDGLRRLPHGSWIAAGLAGLIVVWVAPSSYSAAAQRVRAATPDDLRPLLERVRSEPGVPILTNTCTRKQIETLPEGLPAPVFYVEKGGAIAVAIQKPPEAWFLFVPQFHCRRGVDRVLKSAQQSTPHHEDRDSARLFKLKFPDPKPPHP